MKNIHEPMMFYRLKKTILFFCALLLVSGNSSKVFAQGDAGQPGEFLRYGVNARALAMGRAFTAVTDNANAVYWNPGGLYDIIRDGFGLSFMLSKLYQSTTYNFAAVAVPIELLISADAKSGLAGELRNWNFGLGYLSLSSDGFEVRNGDNQITGETFSDTQSALYFSLTRSFVFSGHRFGIGASYKLLSHELFGNNASVAGIDLGLKFKPNISWLEFGLALQNVNSPDFAFDNGGEDVIPMSARLGLAVQPETGIQLLDAVLVSVDFMGVSPGEQDRDWFLGGEYDLSRINNAIPVKLRLGINSREGFSFGLNLDLPNSQFLSQSSQLLPKLDWAYLSEGETSLGSLGERFSMDFSYTPYTSERWYVRGLQKFSEERYLDAREDFRRSIGAKNPGLTGYPSSSMLRLGDIEVLSARDRLRGLRMAMRHYRDGFNQSRTKVLSDADYNFRSTIFYLQGLMLEKNYSEVVRLTSADTTWLDQPQKSLKDPEVLCIKGWSQYYLGEYDNASWSAQQAQGDVLCDLLLGLIYLHQEKYEDAREKFSMILSTATDSIPGQIYVHPFGDNLILDDAQFLYAYAGYKLFGTGGEKLDARQLGELAQIQRYYPLSHMSRFLQAEGRFDQLVDMVNGGDNDVLEGLYQQYLNAIRQGATSTSDLIANSR